MTAIATNRKATFDFEILERVEGGLALVGTEVKPIRAGKVDLRGAYARVSNGEMWLYDMYVAPYDNASWVQHEPRRPRKVLLRRDQIDSLAGTVGQKGLTLIPLKIYVKRHVIKVELGVARGRRKYDKRRAIIERDVEREVQRTLRDHARGGL